MESSSENSFAWTDTSNDSVNSTSINDINENSNENPHDENGKLIKAKKTRMIHSAQPNDLEPMEGIKKEKSHCETKTDRNILKNNIKTESESENELRKKKKKVKHTEINGIEIDDSMSYDETYLNMKVKQEESLSSTKLKQKKRKRTQSIESTTNKSKNSESYQNNSSREINNTYITPKQESDTDEKNNKCKKKKKKSKKRYDSDNENLSIEDKMDIVDTVVNKQQEIYSKLSKSKYMKISATANDILQEESDGSGCDEISAIKCDDTHSLHTISFINKSTEGENINCSINSTKITPQAYKCVPEQDFDEKLEAPKPRTQRISDRLRFEDDDDSNIESNQVEHEDVSENNKNSLKLKQFLKNNQNLKQLPQSSNINTNLTRDDEIWILKCPKDININDFNNTTINIHGKCKIKVGSQTYEGSAEEQLNIISLLTMENSKYKIRNLPLNGIINLRKRIPKAHFRDDNIMVNNQTNFIPLPETKCRHPLLGSNYKKALKIPATIALRLNAQDSQETWMRTGKRKRNKKDKDMLEHVKHAQSDILMKSESEQPVELKEKKKKKRKIIDEDAPAPKKVKRIKHDPESADAWESEKAIEENLFNY